MTGNNTSPDPPSRHDSSEATELQESRPQKSGRRRCTPLQMRQKYWEMCLDTWFWETVSVTFSLLCSIAIVATLAVYNGRSEPSLPKIITLNTIISVLATGTKSSLIFVASQSIGQLKWIWFQRKRRLVDMQAFDSASRGPGGSLVFLFQNRARSIATLGAIITILAVAFDPFMQQLFSYPTRQLPSKVQHASVKQVLGDSINGVWDEGSGLQALNAGIWTDNFLMEPYCPSGNCTWPIFESLGYCSKCADMTSSADIRNCAAVPVNVTEAHVQPIFCNITLPPPYDPWPIETTFERFDGDDGGLIMHLPQDVVFLNSWEKPFSYQGLFAPMFGFSHAQIGPPSMKSMRQSAAPMLELKKVTGCAMTLCLRTYNISVSNGSPSLRTLSEDYGSWTIIDGTGFSWKPDSKKYTNSNYSERTFEVKNHEGWFINLDFMNGTNSARWFFHEENSTWTSEGFRFGDPTDMIQHIIETGLEPIVENVANSMTKLSRSQSNDTALGTVLVHESYVHVSWIWILVPAAVLVLTLVFLALTIWVSHKETEKGDRALWKTSILPVLYHGLDEGVICNRSDEEENEKLPEYHSSLSQMKQAAGSTNVRLENSESRGRLMLR